MSELWSTTFHRNGNNPFTEDGEAVFVLFICVENANRSQMAEQFARNCGGEKVKSFSAGSNSASRVGGAAVAVMKEPGFEMEGIRPKSLEEIPDVQYDLVVTMGCGDLCPHVRSKRVENREIPDPKGMDEKGACKVRGLIRSRVKNSVKKLLNGK